MSTSRLACVDLPDLPLQILRRSHPEWRGFPLAVVADDSATAPLIHVDPVAAKKQLHTGMRHGVAKSLVPELRAAPVADDAIARAEEELVAALQTFSPRVEPDPDRPGVLHVDPGGLERIYGSVAHWAESVHAYLVARGYRVSIVVGYGKLATFAIARSRTRGGVLVLEDEASTRAALENAPLGALGIAPRLRDDLAVLGIATVGDLAGLPPAELHTRFGEEAARLAELATLSDAQLPLQPRAFADPVRVELEVDPPDDDHARLLFAIKGALHELLRQVAARHMVLGALRITLILERADPRQERIEPAAPTRDARTLLELVRLRITEGSLSANVEGIVLEAELARPEGDQLAMFREGHERDLAAGERALARVRAAFGADSVARARIRDAHLPEARFAWESVDRLRLAHGGAHGSNVPDGTDGGETLPLVRRVLARPKALSSRDPQNPTAGPTLDDGDRVLRLYGPYRVSGGWWSRTVERDYFYGETERGELLWLFWDRPRHRWFLHGVVD